MLENLGLAVATLFAMLGAVLLFSGTSPVPTESAALSLIGGAASLAAGLIAAALILKNKLQWWRTQKQNRQRT